MVNIEIFRAFKHARKVFNRAGVLKLWNRKTTQASIFEWLIVMSMKHSIRAVYIDPLNYLVLKLLVNYPLNNITYT